MRENYFVPVVVDNSNEQKNLKDVFCSFLWKLSPSYRRVKKQFVARDEEYYCLSTDDAFLFVEALTVLDLAARDYLYMQGLHGYTILIKEI